MSGAFTPDPYYSDSDSDLGDGEHSSGRVPYERKWTVSTNHSYTNLVNPEGLRRQRGVDPSVKHPPIVITSPSRSRVEYGDKDAERSPELNLGPHRIEPSQHNENWRPVFLERSDSLKAEIVEAESRDVATMAPVALYSPDYQSGRPELAHIATPTHTLAEGSPSTPRLVPATPPLIKTLDSVSRAQSRTYSGKLAGDEFESDESAREAPSGNRIDTHKMVMEQ
ncbi:NAD-specific glutamate dehydrogenase, putative, partial [Rhizoctonia solani AG-3 Rhs1AP]